jgi:predicted flap endonuclease-1-like 5' DNA nuclease
MEEEMRLYDLRGMQKPSIDSLTGLGIKTSEALLSAGRTRADREALAERLGVTPQEILEWVNRADLARVRGVGEVYADLLENAGVDTVAELAGRNATNLHAKLVEEVQSGLARRAPTLAQVQGWVAQAKSLGRGVEY